MHSIGWRSRFAAAAAGFRNGEVTPPIDVTDARLADYPPPFPSGWYRIANTSELAPGTVKGVQCLGKKFVVFRGRDTQQVSVLDGHCVHQGADLSHGDVKGDCIRCPFHHWQYDSTGRLAHVPDDDTPPRSRTKSYPVREVDGMVWFYWTSDGATGESVPYEPEVHADIEAGDLLYRGDYHYGAVNMHLVEFAENSVDFQHFQPVHGQMLVPWTQIPVPFVTVRHKASWWIDPERPWVTFFKDEPHLEMKGKPIPRSAATAVITLFGPGGVVYFRITLPGLGDVLMYQTHTPTGPMRQEVYFRWFAHKRIPRALVHYVVGSWIGQWKADIKIWENKVYRTRPVLSRADGPVHQMRKWYRQFYPAPTP